MCPVRLRTLTFLTTCPAAGGQTWQWQCRDIIVPGGKEGRDRGVGGVQLVCLIPIQNIPLRAFPQEYKFDSSEPPSRYDKYNHRTINSTVQSVLIFLHSGLAQQAVFFTLQC